LTKVASEIVLFETKDLEMVEGSETGSSIVAVGSVGRNEDDRNEEVDDRGANEDDKKRSEDDRRTEGEKEDDREKRREEEDDTGERKRVSKSSIVGVAGTPVLVRPEGDHGTRKGSPVSRPEPRAEHQGGKGPIGPSYYEDLIL
jgi:hypothetical protein